jgi:hypothetical protein
MKKAGWAVATWVAGSVLVANEIRGVVLAAPVMATMYASGGTWMAIWLGVCSLIGIALSVIAPMYAFKLIKARQ